LRISGLRDRHGRFSRLGKAFGQEARETEGESEMELKEIDREASGLGNVLEENESPETLFALFSLLPLFTLFRLRFQVCVAFLGRRL
jgi:hypothetical protein